jgi:DNA-binding protein HU-beta
LRNGSTHADAGVAHGRKVESAGMNRTELTEALARSTGLSRVDAALAVEGLFDPRDGIIARALRRRRTVRITGFGSFVPRRRTARLGRDPRSGDPIRIPAGTTIAFRPGKPLRETMG